MGTRERRQREFVERERLIVETARVFIREQGLLNLQMSRLAEQCEYAVGTLYQHFSSKEDLLLAVITEGVREYVEIIRRARQWPGRSRERMLAMAVADIVFVQRNPDYFRTAQYSLCDVVWSAATESRREAFLATNKPISGMVVSLIEEAVAAGELSLHGLKPQELALSCGALCEGTHSLAQTRGLLRNFGIDDPYQLMCRHLQTLLNGFGWEPLAVLEDDEALQELIVRIKQEAFEDWL